MITPNLISVLRLLLVPVFLMFLIGGSGNPVAALVVFIIASLSDAVDGIMARKTRNITSLGMFLDPMADKFLILSAFIALAYLGEIPVWLSVLVVFRDVILFTGWVALNILKNLNVNTPSMLSKVTTFFQMLTVILVLVNLGGFINVNENMMSVIFMCSGALTALTGLHYILRAVKIGVNGPLRQ